MIIPNLMTIKKSLDDNGKKIDVYTPQFANCLVILEKILMNYKSKYKLKMIPVPINITESNNEKYTLRAYFADDTLDPCKAQVVIDEMITLLTDVEEVISTEKYGKTVIEIMKLKPDYIGG